MEQGVQKMTKTALELTLGLVLLVIDQSLINFNLPMFADVFIWFENISLSFAVRHKHRSRKTQGLCS